jgi:hypothetical protein
MKHGGGVEQLAVARFQATRCRMRPIASNDPEGSNGAWQAATFTSLIVVKPVCAFAAAPEATTKCGTP